MYIKNSELTIIDFGITGFIRKKNKLINMQIIPISSTNTIPLIHVFGTNTRTHENETSEK